jgi:hypothetical protein
LHPLSATARPSEYRLPALSECNNITKLCDRQGLVSHFCLEFRYGKFPSLRWDDVHHSRGPRWSLNLAGLRPCQQLPCYPEFPVGFHPYPADAALGSTRAGIICCGATNRSTGSLELRLGGLARLEHVFPLRRCLRRMPRNPQVAALVTGRSQPYNLSPLRLG